jgi:hypothetical protein
LYRTRRWQHRNSIFACAARERHAQKTACQQQTHAIRYNARY